MRLEWIAGIIRDVMHSLLYLDSIFFEGRCGRVDYNGKRIGEFGVIHPEVLANFSLSMPCSYLEVDIETFL